VTLLATAAAFASPTSSSASIAPVADRAMWIWYVDRSDGGSLPAIVARAREAGVGTLVIKSGDGTNYWSQFTSAMVQRLHAGGLHVCAWQYVYGVQPVGEADVAARAVHAGADCLVIDAEEEYEGRYAAAAAYLHELRRLVGASYPVGLASFPYVDNHPAFPYSVFLGPGGAQFDMPQMYWREIGGEVGVVYRRSYTYNRIYRRPVIPLGQTFGSPLLEEIRVFRGLAVRYRAPGIAWWDYAWASADAGWLAIGGSYAPAEAAPLGYPTLTEGSTGDPVVWLQEHLARAFAAQRVTGLFGGETFALLRAFQAHAGLSATGRTDASTWRALLRLASVAVPWGGSGTSARRGARQQTAPLSAFLPARGHEIRAVGTNRAPVGRVLGEPR
jgi:hypothetical protein